MTRKSTLRTAFCLIGLLCPAATLAQSTSTSPICFNVEGTVTLHTFSGSGCTSPVGVCGTAEWRGDIRATSSFVASSALPTVDTAVTGVVATTADAQLTLRGGTLATKDAVVLRTTGNGDFAEIDTIVGGTGAFANVTGAWRATGTTQGDTGQGTYKGQLCVTH